MAIAMAVGTVKMKKSNKVPLHSCGGGYSQIENAPYPLPNGRPQFQCTKCKMTWTEGNNGGESLRILIEYNSKK